MNKPSVSGTGEVISGECEQATANTSEPAMMRMCNLAAARCNAETTRRSSELRDRDVGHRHSVDVHNAADIFFFFCLLADPPLHERHEVAKPVVDAAVGANAIVSARRRSGR